MERSSDIKLIADQISDEIIKKMNYVIDNYINSSVVKEGISKFEKNIEEVFDNALIAIHNLKNDESLSNEELVKRIEEIERKRDNKYKRLRNDYDIFIKRNKNIKWNKLQMIRFVYLEMGKYLEKNTDFFLNDKLDELSLSSEEREAVYNDDLLLISDNEKRNKIYQVICKSAAYFLKVCYDKLGIVNSMVHTVDSEDDIKHWFLVAQDDSEKQYFLTLAADLAFIKNKFPTEHFATHISLFNPKGDQSYDAFDLDNIGIKLGIETCVSRITKEEYTGYAIKHDVLSEKELRELDKTICRDDLYDSLPYVNSYKFDMLKSQILKDYSLVNREFRKCFGFDKEEDVSKFRYINPSELDDLELFKKSSDIKYSEFLEFKKFLLPYVLNYLKNNHSEVLPDDCELDNFYKLALINLLNKYGVKVPDSTKSFTSIVTDNRKKFDKIKNKDDIECLNLLKSCGLLIENLDKYITSRDTMNKALELDKEAVSDIQHERIEKITNYHTKVMNEALNNLTMRRVSYYLQDISTITSVNDDLNFSPTEYVSQERVVNRFILLFPKIMDFNSSFNSTVSKTNFSCQNYSEQIVIIKRVLAAMFSDLTHENCNRCSTYTRNKIGNELDAYAYSPVENRINTYPLKDKDTGEYCVGFTFPAADCEGIVEFIYIPHCNELRRRNPIEDRKKYWIASVRFNEKLRKLEEIDSMIRDENDYTYDGVINTR